MCSQLQQFLSPRARKIAGRRPTVIVLLLTKHIMSTVIFLGRENQQVFGAILLVCPILWGGGGALSRGESSFHRDRGVFFSKAPLKIRSVQTNHMSRKNYIHQKKKGSEKKKKEAMMKGLKVSRRRDCRAVSPLCAGIWSAPEHPARHRPRNQKGTAKHENSFTNAFIMIDSEWLKEYFYPSKLKDISPVPHLQAGEHLIYLSMLLKRKKSAQLCVIRRQT